MHVCVYGIVDDVNGCACACSGVNVEAFVFRGARVGVRGHPQLRSASALLKQGLLFTTVHASLAGPPASTSCLSGDALASCVGPAPSLWLYVGAGI